MQKIDSEIRLSAAILLLENRKKIQATILKEQLHCTYHSLTPINLLKSTFKAVAESRELKSNISDTALGLTAGYISKTLFVRLSHNPLKKLIGTALLFGITNAVAKNPEVFKTVARSIFNIFRHRPKTRIHSVDTDYNDIK